MKRQRVGLACEKCRVLKAKCDGKRPECGRCKGYGFACTWATRRKLSSMPPGSNNPNGIPHTSGSDTQTSTEQGDHVVCSYIMKSYEALIRSFQSKLDQTNQATLDLTLASIRRHLPDELTEPTQHLEQANFSEDEQLPTYVGQASDIFFFKTVESCMREHHASELGEDDPHEPYYDQTNIPEYTTLLGRPLLLPSHDEGARYLDVFFFYHPRCVPVFIQTPYICAISRYMGKKVERPSR